MTELNPLPFFLVGVLGGVHCVGMCGGIVVALSPRTSGASAIRLHLSYSLGRIASYTLAGAIAGGLGAVLADGFSGYLREVLYLVANVLLCALGLYLLGLTRVMAVFEQVGGHLWRRLQPLERRLRPLRGIKRALLLGLLWGWLPCGLVYGVLASSLASASAASGAWLMLAFGAGTLPNLLITGLFATRAQRWAKQKLLRALSGTVVLAYGLWGLWLQLQ